MLLDNRDTHPCARQNDRQHTQVRSMLLAAMAVTCILAFAFGVGLGERSYLYFAVMLLCQMAHFAVIGGELRFVFAGAEALERNLQAGRIVGSLGTVASIEFLRAAREGDVLTAQATERQRGRRSGVYDVELRDARGELVALFRRRSIATDEPVTAAI